MSIGEYPKDLVGLQFGELTVLEFMGRSRWKCQCSCGELRIIPRNNLVSGNSTSCGHNSKKDKLKDLTGQKFGDLTVELYDKESKRWRCICSCGNIVYRRSWDLRNGKATKCDNIENHLSKRLEHLEGMKFGELTVLEYNGDSTWMCICSCGKRVAIRASDLKSGRKNSCGHTLNQNKVIDITGQTFGELTALRYLGESLWECQCSCGNKVNVLGSLLRSGTKKSCGHGYSKLLIDISGETFGSLDVIDYNKELGKWRCECKCGKICYVKSQHLRRGDITSCGCNKFIDSVKLIDTILNIENQIGRLLTLSEAIEKVGVSEGTLRRHLGDRYTQYIYVDKHISGFEEEVYQYIKGIYNKHIERSNKKILDGQELDIYIPDLNLAIECNGNYWHSDIVRPKYYHRDKYLNCINKGIRLVNIYEFEWISKKEKIKAYLNNLLLDKIVIYARNTIVDYISTDTKHRFIEANHLQGDCISTINLGLTDTSGRLVQVMTLGKPRFTSKYEYEILRICTLDGHMVYAGASKLLNFFIREYKPKSVVSYCNLDKFSGGVYMKMGMQEDIMTDPGYVWTNNRSTSVLSRYQTQKDKLVHMGLGSEDESEDSIMRGLKYLKIYNVGNKIFNLILEEE